MSVRPLVKVGGSRTTPDLRERYKLKRCDQWDFSAGDSTLYNHRNSFGHVTSVTAIFTKDAVMMEDSLVSCIQMSFLNANCFDMKAIKKNEHHQYFLKGPDSPTA